jgi:hypothetical protein
MSACSKIEGRRKTLIIMMVTTSEEVNGEQYPYFDAHYFLRPTMYLPKHHSRQANRLKLQGPPRALALHYLLHFPGAQRKAVYLITRKQMG